MPRSLDGAALGLAFLYYLSYIGSMKTVSARDANHGFSELLSAVERGEELLITKRGRPVAVLSPYRPPLMTAERQAAIDHAIKVMKKGLPWGKSRRFTRDEMHADR
jgi:prevent-host-death family protein